MTVTRVQYYLGWHLHSFGTIRRVLNQNSRMRFSGINRTFLTSGIVTITLVCSIWNPISRFIFQARFSAKGEKRVGCEEQVGFYYVAILVIVNPHNHSTTIPTWLLLVAQNNEWTPIRPLSLNQKQFVSLLFPAWFCFCLLLVAFCLLLLVFKRNHLHILLLP